MAIRPFQYSFNGGEVGPEFDGRVDHARYFSALKELINWIPTPLGGVTRRPGTRFVASVKDHTRKVRLLPFEFSVQQAYVLEVGHQYLRFYKNGARIENPPGTPVEVVSPYQENELFALQTAQSADVMWIVHPNHAPRKLQRFSDTVWRLDPITFLPPPSTEEDEDLNVALMISGTTVTAAAAVWLDADVGRHILITEPTLANRSRAVIDALGSAAPATVATIIVLSGTFPSSLAAGEWRLSRSPQATLRVWENPERKRRKQRPQGTSCFVDLVRRDIQTPNLVNNGDFANGLVNWTNWSIATMATGTHTGSATPTDLTDTAQDFISKGIRPGMFAANLSNGTSTKVSNIGDARHILITGTIGGQWNPGNSYRIDNTGAAAVVDGACQLIGGPAGVAWIEQGVPTVSGQTYRVLFDVSEGPLACQVGSMERQHDLLNEVSFTIGTDREAFFTATSPTSYVQFRNNQPTAARVDRVRVTLASAQGFRSPDVGKYLKVQNGVILVTSLVGNTSAYGVIQTDLQSDADAVAGAWTLEVSAWSATRGFPRAISFHQQRLGFAGTTQQPLTIWQSEIADYEQFGAGALADSSLEQEFSANTMNTIVWMEPFRDQLVGTAAGEHLLRGVNGPLTPLNGEQLPQTRVGSDGLPPLRIDNALILLLRGARQIKALQIDDVGQTVRGKDHTLLVPQITESGVVQWVLQTKPRAMIWAVRADGTLIGETYEQVEDVQGWHRHTTDGAFESVCVVPVNTPVDQETEEVYVSVRRTIAAQTRRSIERLVPGMQVDSGLPYSGSATSTLTGLDHLEGKTVKVVDLSTPGQPALLLDRIVSGGAITLEQAVTAAHVGLPYTSRLVTVRPEIPLRNGTLQGQLKRWSTISARVLATLGLTINGQTAIFRTPADPMDQGLAPRTGDVQVTALGWTRDGHITVEQTEPLPATLVGLYGELEVEED